MSEFEWDEERNRINRAKHDVDFDTVIWVFRDIHAFEQGDRLRRDKEGEGEVDEERE